MELNLKVALSRCMTFLVTLHQLTLMIAYVDGAPTSTRSQEQRTGALQQNKGYMVYTDELSLQPSYEYPINPFLSHIDQAWKLKAKPVPNQNLSKDLTKPFNKYNVNAASENGGLPMDYPLDVDPEKPHFMDETDYINSSEEETKAFGNEEKDFGDLLNVLFSSDY